jgi:hypothetical protein
VAETVAVRRAERGAAPPAKEHRVTDVRGAPTAEHGGSLTRPRRN